MPRAPTLARGRDKSVIVWEPLPLPAWPELVTPVVIKLFDELRISVAINTERDQWHPFHESPSVAMFEYEHGVAARRWKYNEKCFKLASQQGRPIVGEHAGFHDLFVPVLAGRSLRGMLVAGPFATSRPTSAEILGRWRQLTGSQGRLTDPAFFRYVSGTLSTLRLDPTRFEAFRGLMICFADLLARRGETQRLTKEIESCRRTLVGARLVERMWETARIMVDERSPRVWDEHDQLAPIGMTDLPTHVIVGLLLGPKSDFDPLASFLRRDAFQRAGAEAARQLGGIACGKVGDHGVVFLVDCKGRKARARERLLDIAARARQIARRHDLQLYAGISESSDPQHLPDRYHEAHWAAEKALSSGQTVIFGEPRREKATVRLRSLRTLLATSIEDRPTLLSPRFERYIEAVLAYSGYRLEATRAQLEAGLERLVEPLLSKGFLDDKSSRELYAAIERSTEHAVTVMDLVSFYRQRVTEIEKWLTAPVAARQERSTERAQAFVDEHLAERLTLAQVARVAGLAPDYFSTLFKREHGVSFVRYVQGARIDHAERMLTSTKLSVEQIQELCGFRNRTYFHRDFKARVGTAPATYRAAAQRSSDTAFDTRSSSAIFLESDSREPSSSSK